MITALTPEQEALIPVYREKWRAIALSTERIDRQKVAQIVQDAYTKSGKDHPKVLFFDSPHAAFRSNNLDLRNSYRNYKNYWYQWELPDKLLNVQYELSNQLLNWLGEQLSDDFFFSLLDDLSIDWHGYFLWKNLIDCLIEQQNIPDEVYCFLTDDVRLETESWLTICHLTDVILSVFNAPYSTGEWEMFQSIVQNSGWIYPFREVCLVCDRPTKLAFDAQGRLHADKEPAIEFADGFCVYAHHGELVTEPDGR